MFTNDLRNTYVYRARTRTSLLRELLEAVYTHTGSVWYHVSGVEDDLERVGVQAYVLKKIINDLPLEPIPVALKWGHLSDLKLAYPNFRTQARIDMLLHVGAEVFSSILRDGRRAGPRGTPSALNTCFGWVLFGKIDGRTDVVDVAKHTLEQLVYTNETET